MKKNAKNGFMPPRGTSKKLLRLAKNAKRALGEYISEDDILESIISIAFAAGYEASRDARDDAEALSRDLPLIAREKACHNCHVKLKKIDSWYNVEGHKWCEKCFGDNEEGLS